MTKKIVIDSTFKFRTEIFDLLNPPILVHVRVAGKRFRNRRFALNEMFQLKVSKFAILGISGLSRSQGTGYYMYKSLLYCIK